MKKSTVIAVLCAYFATVGTAAVFQIDGFPLTWVPMYSGYKPRPPDRIRKSKVRDKSVAAKGFEVTRRDGTTDRVGNKQLNIPKRNMWRLYYERAFGKGSPKYKHWKHTDEFNQRLRRLGPVALTVEADWQRRLFESLNKTLGHRPEDPGFIVEYKAEQEVRHIRPDFTLDHVSTRTALVKWKDEWAVDFANGAGDVR